MTLRTGGMSVLSWWYVLSKKIVGSMAMMLLTISQAVSATVFWVAVMTAIARTVIVFRFQKRLFIADAVLLIAVACLCAAAGVMIISFPSMALLEAVFTEPLQSELPSDGIEKAQYRIIQQGCVPLCLTTIYAAKFSFLLFLGPLTRRFRNLTLYWDVVSMVTILAWAFFGVSIPFVPSDNSGSKISQFRRHAYSSIVPDIVTTLLSSYSLIDPFPSIIL